MSRLLSVCFESAKPISRPFVCLRDFKHDFNFKGILHRSDGLWSLATTTHFSGVFLCFN